jgi:hypothetical protein
MSIFDITAAGACMNAIRAANKKDRQNAHRIQDTPVAAEREAGHAPTMPMIGAFGRALERIVAFRLVGTPRSMAV